jgi:agmatine deiminase
LGFPSHAELWEDNLAPAQAETAALARALAGPGKERVRLMVRGDAAEQAARALLDDAAGIEIVRGLFGDIWLRDTGPIIAGCATERRAQGFRFNGWGGKYELAGDETIGQRLAARAALHYGQADWILEAGAIDHDGSGIVVTTEQCLLNPNRNPGLTKQDAAGLLRRDLGFERIIWLGEGLLNDHTDGHVDNLARFVAPGRVAIPTSGRDDPNEAVYRDAARRLAEAGLDIVTLPSPGRILNEEGDIVPASYMNFYIGNAAVVVPQYGASNDCAAVEAVQALFPERIAIGLRADHILTGGGSFHCISQQVPA